MTREEQIEKMAMELIPDRASRRDIWIAGAEWADANPNINKEAFVKKAQEELDEALIEKNKWKQMCEELAKSIDADHPTGNQGAMLIKYESLKKELG